MIMAIYPVKIHPANIFPLSAFITQGLFA